MYVCIFIYCIIDRCIYTDTHISTLYLQIFVLVVSVLHDPGLLLLQSCAETFMAVSESCSRSTRYEKLSPLFVNLLCDMSRWVSHI